MGDHERSGKTLFLSLLHIQIICNIVPNSSVSVTVTLREVRFFDSTAFSHSSLVFFSAASVPALTCNH